MAKLVDDAFLLISLQQNKGLFIIFALVLHRAGQCAQVFKAFFFAIFRRDLVDFLLLHFKQLAPLRKPGLPLQQGPALRGVRLQAGEQVVALAKLLGAAYAALKQPRLKGNLQQFLLGM